MKPKFLILFTLLSLTFSLEAQVVTSDPALPTEAQSVTIFFDATEGNAGLKDFTGDVYAHTGVLTENSTANNDWKYVKTDWGENTAATKMTRISANLYSLEITPTIRSYYGVPENETISHMAFVFRSSDNSREGKDAGGSDIFIEVFADGLNVSITSPQHNTLINPGTYTYLNFSVSASESATINLYNNNSLIASGESTSLSESITFTDAGDYWLKVTAKTADEYVADSVFVHAMEDQVNQARPEGVVNGINYIDDETVTLVLHAPGKENVFVIGDFNHWTPNSAGRMQKDNEHWWVTLDQLIPGVEYAYQYVVDGELLIADPYTEKVLDPWNDRWISDETYPELKEYPHEYTNGLASVFQTGQTAYQWKHADYAPPEQENLVVYELLVRDFIAAHDWKTLTDTLNYLDNLGINAIELMPVNEFEGNESWGYNPSFYFAPDKYYGPAEDLKVFIDSCHARGIAVILDMTLNHSFSQSPLVQLYFNSTTGKVTSDNLWYNVESPNPVYFWGFDFNHESPATQQFVDRINSHWLTNYDVDGFRFDFTKGFTNTPGDGWAYDQARINILKRMADQLWKVNPDAYVILEHLADNSEERVLANHGMMLWGNLNYNYNEATMGYHEDGKSNFGGISHKSRGFDDPHLVGYMESHDEERLMFKNLEYGNYAGHYYITGLNNALARMELAGTFFFTIPGPKMLWQFGELGYDFSIDYNGRVGNKPIRWDYFEFGTRLRLYQVWSSLIHLKTTEPAFSTDDFTLNVAYATKRIELNHEDMDVRIIGNFDVVPQSIDPNFSQTGTWYNYFDGQPIEVTDVNELINLAPGEYKLYTTKQLNMPAINAKPAALRSPEKGLELYPVPAMEQIYFKTEQAIQEVRIFDLGGRLVQKNVHVATSNAIDVAALPGGMYLLKLITEEGNSLQKIFIKE